MRDARTDANLTGVLQYYYWRTPVFTDFLVLRCNWSTLLISLGHVAIRIRWFDELLRKSFELPAIIVVLNGTTVVHFAIPNNCTVTCMVPIFSFYCLVYLLYTLLCGIYHRNSEVQLLITKSWMRIVNFVAIKVFIICSLLNSFRSVLLASHFTECIA